MATERRGSPSFWRKHSTSVVVSCEDCSVDCSLKILVRSGWGVSLQGYDDHRVAPDEMSSHGLSPWRGRWVGQGSLDHTHWPRQTVGHYQVGENTCCAVMCVLPTSHQKLKNV